MDILDDILALVFILGGFTLLVSTVTFILEGIERVQKGIKRRKRLQKEKELLLK